MQTETYNKCDNESSPSIEDHSEKLFRECKTCEKLLELNDTNFYIKKNQSAQKKKILYHPYCKKCNSDQVLKRQRELKRWAVEYLGGQCICCGYNKYMGALEFHHLDPSQKDFAISQLKTYTKAVIINELDKCVILCSNCHREFHGGLIILPESIARKDREDVNLKQISFRVLDLMEYKCIDCGNSITNKAERCEKCAKFKARKVKNRPTAAELESYIWQIPITYIAGIYNISDNAVRKWCKGYGIEELPPNGYWQKLWKGNYPPDLS